MRHQGNIIIGNNSGNVNSSISAGGDEPPGCQPCPMQNTIHYNNINIHIGLFGERAERDRLRNVVHRPAGRHVAFWCAGAILMNLSFCSSCKCRMERETRIVSSSYVEFVTLYDTPFHEHDLMLNCVCMVRDRKRRY